MVAHVVQRFRPAPLTGSERYMDAMTLYMVARGYRVDVYTSTAVEWKRVFIPLGKGLPSSVENYGRLRVVRLRPGYLRQLVSRGLCRLGFSEPFCFMSGPRLPGLPRAMLGDYDVVHATPAPFPYLVDALRAARRVGAGFVITPFMHFDLREYRDPFLIGVLRSADFVVAATACEARILKRVYGVRRVGVVELGIWVKRWVSGLVPRDEARAKLGLPEDAFVILLPSRAWSKGAYHVLEAAGLLAKKGVKTVVLVFGLASDEGFTRVRELVSSKGVEVRDYGVIDEDFKKLLFSAADVLAQPSIADSFGIVYLEAWASTIPVIAADTLAMRCVVRHGVDGFRVRFGDVASLATILGKLAREPGLVAEMGETGYKRVIARYDWSVAGEKLSRIYREVAASRGGSGR